MSAPAGYGCDERVQSARQHVDLADVLALQRDVGQLPVLMDLEALKLKLLALDRDRPLTANRQEDGSTIVAELEPSQRWIREQGRDWPQDAWSMSGLARLSDLQACVETVVAEGVPGDVIECGCWRGGACMLARAVLNELGETGRTVWAADTFAGFAEADHGAWEAWLSRYQILAADLETVQAQFKHLGLEDGVEFLAGRIEDTLPALHAGPWAVIRLDMDTGHATRLALEELYDGLSSGGFVVIDDYWILPEVAEAVESFKASRGDVSPVVQIDWSAARWRR